MRVIRLQKTNWLLYNRLPLTLRICQVTLLPFRHTKNNNQRKKIRVKPPQQSIESCESRKFITATMTIVVFNACERHLFIQTRVRLKRFLIAHNIEGIRQRSDTKWCFGNTVTNRNPTHQYFGMWLLQKESLFRQYTRIEWRIENSQCVSEVSDVFNSFEFCMGQTWFQILGMLKVKWFPKYW